MYYITLCFLFNFLSATASFIVVHISKRSPQEETPSKLTQMYGVKTRHLSQKGQSHRAQLKALCTQLMDGTERRRLSQVTAILKHDPTIAENTNKQHAINLKDSNNWCTIAHIFLWMMNRQERKDDRSSRQETWDMIARKIDSYLFPIFLCACIILAVVSLVLVTSQD